MRIFVIVNFWCYVLSVLSGLLLLANVEYPRKRSPRGMGEEVMLILISAGCAVWAGWMLWL